MSTATLNPDDLVELVRFDFRFDRDPIENDKKSKWRQSLVGQFVNERKSAYKVQDISLFPVARVGHSGSEVFYLNLYYTEIEDPERFIAKFQNTKSTDEEKNGADRALVAGLCAHVSSYKHESEDIGLIVYRISKLLDSIEFREYFLDPAIEDHKCAEVMDSIFLTVGKRTNVMAPRKTFFEDYEKYVNRKSKPLQRVKALMEVAPPQIGIGEIASSIFKTYERMEEKLKFFVLPYVVHGDLHARNLMLSKLNPRQTELIDFDWVDYGHPAKDFVLMEFTLKYMLLQELLPKVAKTKNESLHIQPRHFEAFEKYLCRHGFDLPSLEKMTSELLDGQVPPHQAHALKRVYHCLTVIRKFAGQVLDNYCLVDRNSGIDAKTHYFAGLFLVTIGMFAYSEVDQLSAMIGLQSLGGEL